MINREALEKIANYSQESEKLRWVWAVYEQEKMWLANDAMWHDAANNGWPDDSIYPMLYNYSLLRGKRGQLLAAKKDLDGNKCPDRKNNREIFANAAVKRASELVDNNPVINAKVWRELDCEIRKKVEKPEREVTDNWFMPSATLKAMWFSAPDRIPMYDQLAVKGLKLESKDKDEKKKQISPDNYLHLFECFYNKKTNYIDCALKVSGSKYKYKRRIADKYLWLIGHPSEKLILEKFHCGITSLLND